MKTYKQLKEQVSGERAHRIISQKLATMEFLKKGGITRKEEPKVEKAHKELDDVIHDKFGKRVGEL